MTQTGPVLNKLVGEDIDEKIYLNQKTGIDLKSLIDAIEEEKLDFIWTEIRCKVQIQFYTEQLKHMRTRLSQLEGKENPYLDEDYKKKLAELS